MPHTRDVSTPPDPYTPILKPPRERFPSASELRDAPRLRSASTSAVPRNLHVSGSKIRPSKRHSVQLSPSSLPSSTPTAIRKPSISPTGSSIRRPRAMTVPNGRPPAGPSPPPSPSARALKNLDPKPLLRSLNALLDPKTQRIPDFLDVDHILALYERDMMERDQRDAIKRQVRAERAEGRISGHDLTVFGTSLREATMYASTVAVLGGCEHDLPIVVVSCVKELCCNSFQTPPPGAPKPNRDRLLALISDFDSEPYFGSKTTLNSADDLLEIYALLSTYLFALPDPVVLPEIFEALWAWCVVPSLQRTDFLEDESALKTLHTATATDVCVRIAHILLLLMPIPNLSLFVYMMGVFKRLPHLIIEDIALAVLAGKTTKVPTAKSVCDGRGERAEILLRWLSERWDVIFKALFPSSEIKSNVTISKIKPPSSSSICKVPRKTETPGDADSDASSVHSSSALHERLLDVTMDFDSERDTVQIQKAKKRQNRNAVLNNRTGVDSPAQDRSQKPVKAVSPVPPSPSPEPERTMSYDAAIRRISALEREVERTEVAMSDAINETFRAREQVKDLEAKLRDATKRPPVLELALDPRAADDWHAVLHSDTEALKAQLGNMKKERDAALKLVDEIKGVIN
ncbi:unnamed protein product [Mycena citricolor]|uniref:Rho-GAP domain-containing protein n=1 Tax=Mycena citricolor TaxID=2018698 RepID=A0AAD2JXR0_9AGAR|nr:unnamed protein product [Mycena citricolor]